jgi:hypothetical protein
LAQINGEIELQVEGAITQRQILDKLETMYPMLRGTIRDFNTKQRRPFIRFFACGQDFSDEPLDALLPDEVALGTQPFRIVGAIAGG